MDAIVVSPPNYACVVAIDRNRGIGRDNDLPWPKLPGDLGHFKRITCNTRIVGARNAVIMGRRTWDSVPAKYRPLAGRINVVVSRTTNFGDHAIAARDLASAVDAATAAGAESIYVVGGGQIYANAVEDPRCTSLYITQLDAEFPCDAHFPNFADRFVRAAADEPRSEAGVTYTIERWDRRA